MDTAGLLGPIRSRVVWTAFCRTDLAHVAVIGADPYCQVVDEDDEPLFVYGLSERRLGPGPVTEVLKRADQALLLCGYNRIGPWSMADRQLHRADVERFPTGIGLGSFTW